MNQANLMAIAFWILAVALLIIFIAALAAAFPRLKRKEQDETGTIVADFLPGIALVALIILLPGGRNMTVQTMALAAILSWMSMYAAIRFGSLSHSNPENRGPRP